MTADGFRAAAVDPALAQANAVVASAWPGLIDDLYADAREEALEGFAEYEPEQFDEYEKIMAQRCEYFIDYILNG